MKSEKNVRKLAIKELEKSSKRTAFVSRKLIPELPAHLSLAIENRDWPLVEKFETNEGYGLRSATEIPSGSEIVSYGGEVIVGEFDITEDFKYCLEYKIGTGKKDKVWFNHPAAEESFDYFSLGKYINHSKIHPNLKAKLYIDRFKKFHLIFKTIEYIQKNQELVYSYGPEYPGLNPCVASCNKCLKN